MRLVCRMFARIEHICLWTTVALIDVDMSLSVSLNE